MASKIIETWQDDQGRNLVRYESGLVKDADTGLVVSPAPHTLITLENSSAHHRARKEQRQNLIRETASAHPGAVGFQKSHGDMAYIAAMTEKIMDKAMRPGDPKQVEAARFLMREAGDSSEDDNEGKEDAVSQVRDIIRDVARLVDQALHLREGKSLDNGG